MHVVQVILSGAHNTPERIYKSRMHDNYSYSFSRGLAQSVCNEDNFNAAKPFVACVASISTEIN